MLGTYVSLMLEGVGLIFKGRAVFYLTRGYLVFYCCNYLGRLLKGLYGGEGDYAKSRVYF